MTMARKTVVNDGESGVYHCISRCVRRAFLCGLDPYSQKDYEHRRVWIRDRIVELSGIYGVEVLSYAVMSNHLHLVVQTLPERVESWDAEVVVRRWLRLYPVERDGFGRAVEPSDALVREWCGDASVVKRCRERLGSLSWFMRSLNEPIARRANREDDCRGHFWEGRFKCQRLVDEGAVLACMVYVDLNPVRAGMAQTPEGSEFTSVYDRIAARQAQVKLREEADRKADAQFFEEQRARSRGADWLGGFAKADGGEDRFVDVDLDKYLELLDWTGRCVKEGKKGAIPVDLLPVLERLELDTQEWVENVQRFGGLFSRIAGKAEQVMAFARQVGQKWLRGKSGSECLYAVRE